MLRCEVGENMNLFDLSYHFDLPLNLRTYQDEKEKEVVGNRMFWVHLCDKEKFYSLAEEDGSCWCGPNDRSFHGWNEALQFYTRRIQGKRMGGNHIKEIYTIPKELSLAFFPKGFLSPEGGFPLYKENHIGIYKIKLWEQKQDRIEDKKWIMRIIGKNAEWFFDKPFQEIDMVTLHKKVLGLPEKMRMNYIDELEINAPNTFNRYFTWLMARVI